MASAADAASELAVPLGIDPNSAVADAVRAHLEELRSLRRPPPPDSEGSVLAFVTFPCGNDSARACDGEAWRDVQIRMSYERLMALGSAKIRDMFSPRAQARFRRRLNLESLPPGIEYVLDFTPPVEGPELADLTAALWLPPVVKLWFLAGQYLPRAILADGLDTGERPLADKAVGPIFALGHDDVCKNTKCLSGSVDVITWQGRADVPGIVDEDPSSGLSSYIPGFRRVQDYCPIRHRVAIIRLLRAINGEGLLLNSAVRMWTVARLAIDLDVPQVVVDPVAQWLVAPPNSKFIEICPERAFQLAYALKIPDVLVAAFKILVSERAVDHAAPNPSPRRPASTWLQRPRDDYGDYPSDPVEYASRSFAERMQKKLSILRSDAVFDRLNVPIPEWNKLQKLGALIDTLDPCALQRAYRDLTSALIAAFHAHVEQCLDDTSVDGRRSDLVEAQREHYIADLDRKPLVALYSKLSPSQRVLTPFFWERLKKLPFQSQFTDHRHHGHSIQQLAIAFNKELQGARDTDVLPSLAELTDVTDRPWQRLYFVSAGFYAGLRVAVQGFSNRVLSHSARGRNHDDDPIPLFLSDHLLLSLDGAELDYLPIWAGGLDDGSGGAFQEPVPPADMGPSEPGPGYHTGHSVAATETDAGTTEQPSELELRQDPDLDLGVLTLRDDDGGDDDDDDAKTVSGTARSLQVQCSEGGARAPRTAVAGDPPSSEGPESLAADADDASSVYAEARLALPAAHQAPGRAAEDAVSSVSGGLGEEEEEEDEWTGVSDDDSNLTLDGFEEVGVDVVAAAR